MFWKKVYLCSLKYVNRLRRPYGQMFDFYWFGTDGAVAYNKVSFWLLLIYLYQGIMIGDFNRVEEWRKWIEILFFLV